MTVAEALASTRRTLEPTLPDAGIEAEVLVRLASAMDRTSLYASLNEPVDADVSRRLASFVQRRRSGEPLAYITGRREFYGLEMDVSPNVLVPRQETETLVENVIEFTESRWPEGRVTIVDVGTGSGAIAVALAMRLSGATVLATDISFRALEIAAANRRRHGVADRVSLLRCDMLDGLAGRFDVIVSNPPYIASGDMPELPSDVRREPAVALDGGPDGLRATERLVRQAGGLLAPEGGLFIEIAPDQPQAVAAIVHGWMPGSRVSIGNDLSDTPRTVLVQP